MIAGTAIAAERVNALDADDAILNIPGNLSAVEDSQPRKSLSKYFQGPQKARIQKCTKECVTTCTRGGAGVLL